MKHIQSIVFILLSIFNPVLAEFDFIEPFDNDWKFKLGDPSNAQNIDCDDNQWRTLNLPHDFSIEQPFDSLNTTGPEGGYAYSGIGWYRKSFITPVDPEIKRTIVQFDGIYRNSEVWINGQRLGFWPYGYTSFYYDLTPYLNKNGAENIIAVRVDNSKQPNSRWYTGAGIYRHVWLKHSGDVHFKNWGIFAHTLNASNEQASIAVELEIDCLNDLPQNVELLIRFKNNQNSISEKFLSIQAKGEMMLYDTIEISKPQLWSIKNPNLYTLECIIIKDEKIIDHYKSAYGIRTVEFDPNKGFLLNGEAVKLKGTNNHHDGGPLGAACADHTFYRQLRILKEMGCNALRISHNPPAKELLECADSMGFVVIDEIFDEWRSWKREAGYSKYFDEWYKKDIAHWMRRDRNHASVIAWSLGNEVVEQRKQEGPEILKMLKETALQHDNTRPFTAGCNEIPSVNQSGMGEILDIIGYNYREPHYEEDHINYPNRVIYGSETTIYPYQPGDQFPLHSYEDWAKAQQSPYIAGEFIWTGFDYLGETGIGLGGTGTEPWNYWPKWPYRSAVCGVIDICGFKKPGYFFRQALWSEDPVIYMAVGTKPSAKNAQQVPFWGWPDVLPHWDHQTQNDTLPVHVYTNCNNVELFLNGQSLGNKILNKEKEAFLIWNVPYSMGKLEAIGHDQHGVQHSFKLESTSEAKNIILSAEKDEFSADGKDLAYIKVQITDKNGNIKPFAKHKISFEVNGKGIIKAVGNGDPTCHMPFSGKEMDVHNGQCLLIVQSTTKEGSIEIMARSKGLKSGTLTLHTNKK